MHFPSQIASLCSALVCGFISLFSIESSAEPAAKAPSKVLIGNILREAPCGIAWVVNDSAAFVLDTGGPYVAGTAAPDDSYHAYRFAHKDVNVSFEWGRIADDVVGRLSADKPTTLEMRLSSGWPGWTSAFTPTRDGANGIARPDGGQIEWRLRTSPAPESTSPSTVTINIEPDRSVRFIAGLNSLPDFDSIDGLLDKARNRYEDNRPKASGDFGDFVGAIEDNINNSRIYSSDNHALAYSVSRGWSSQPNGCPYFCWDSFFTANLGAIDDPTVARNTVRAILSYQSPEGLVPNFAHWNGTESGDRSQPPVASLCVWKIHQRYPNDLEFLAEIYPKLVAWHYWWQKSRDAKDDGLLEWGSATKDFQAAQYETGWDDNLHYAGASMKGTTMDAYAIDLSSMWSMDTHYLALIAGALGHAHDAAGFRGEQEAMNRNINARLWNDNLNCYCSKFWNDAGFEVPLDQSAFGPGFEGSYFNDRNMRVRAASSHETNLNFDWHGKSPVTGVAATNWSAQWSATLTPPASGIYDFIAAAEGRVRVLVNGSPVIDGQLHPDQSENASVSLSQGKAVPITVEYSHANGGSRLGFSVKHTRAPFQRGEFLTRMTPMNFYPLSAEVPSKSRVRDVLRLLTNPQKFWGQYLLPTLAYDDPDYHQQEYWRGDIWGPPNYIVWPGIEEYASPAQITEYADRNVALFMTNWLSKRVCGENYLSTDGSQNHDAHYTWGALLCLVGLESIVDVDDSGRIVLNGAQTKSITLKNIPLLGRIYDVKTGPGSAQLVRDGKVILAANGKIVRALAR
ncbi:MAG TPA: PA14 domain-containing protein [Verrucomicrobiae bacterium]|jgi:hypothetical protein